MPTYKWYPKFRSKSGIIISNETLEKETEIALSSSLKTVGENIKLFILAVNIREHPMTIANETEVPKFSILKAEQAKNLTAIDPELIALAAQKSESNSIIEINQLIKAIAD